jgi:hypothetical protein
MRLQQCDISLRQCDTPLPAVIALTHESANFHPIVIPAANGVRPFAAM